MLRTQRAYYDSVHVVRESVAQPAMLAGGTLRGYQLGGLRFLLSLVNNGVNGILADEMARARPARRAARLAAALPAAAAVAASKYRMSGAGAGGHP